MSDTNDTLNIGSLRPKPRPEDLVQPERKPDPVKDPGAAEAARARILAAAHSPLSDYKFGLHPDAPAHPTTELITDKHELAKQFKSEPLVVKGRKLPPWLRSLLTAVGVFALVLFAFKVPVLYSQAQYTFKSAPAATAPAVAAEIVPPENTISIPKINVKAPVNYEPSLQEAAIQKSLETGVVHYGNTAVPGEVGNVAIFGHSSNDWWEPGNYKFVFVLLDKLAPGDQITIDYQSKRYVYEVTGSKVVEPTDIGVLNQTPTPTLSIITCTPPGTSLKRLVVTAKQISPDPSGAAIAKASQTQTGSSLPSGAPSSGFFDEFAKTWANLMSMFTGGAKDPAASPAATSGQLPTAK